MSDESYEDPALEADDSGGPGDGDGGDGPSTPAQPPAGGMEPIAIEDEVRASFLSYAMHVIVSRALPDVRDGLKPVHRRILYAMNQEGLLSNRPHSKSVGVVGEVLKHSVLDRVTTSDALNCYSHCGYTLQMN